MAGPFSGTFAIRAIRDGDFQATIFAGTNTGLQGAVDYVQSAGGKVSIGPGTISITDDINITGNKVTVEGAGDETIFSNDHATGVDIFSVTGDNVTLCNFRIEGNNGSKTFGRGIDTDGDDTTIYNVTINATPDACIASGAGGANFRTIVHGCRLLSPGDAGSTDGYGVLMSSCTDAKIYGNYVSAPRFSGIYAFGTCARPSISFNTVLNGLDNGIRSASTATSARVFGNYVSGCAVDGFRMDGLDTVCSGNHSIGNTLAGIKTDGTTGGSWTGNICTGNGNSGLHVGNAVGNVTRLLIAKNYADSNTGAGVIVNPSTTRAHTNLFITGNLLTRNSFEGIRIIAASFPCTAFINSNASQGNVTSDTENLSATNWTYPATGAKN